MVSELEGPHEPPRGRTGIQPIKLAFTLVEVLVVVGIVSTLAGILFPVLARARESAVRTTSLSNLHQLGLAAIAYAGDNEDTLPQYRNFEPLLVQRDPNVTTSGIPTDSKDPGRLVACLAPYLSNSDSIWHCPADPYRFTGETFGQINHKYSSYTYWAFPEGYNSDLDREWPIVTPMSKLMPPGDLFFEPTGAFGKSIRSYWQASVAQYVLADGSAKAFKFPNNN